MNTFNATALSDRFDKGRCTGSLETVAGSLVFTSSQGETFKMSMRGIEMRIGGAGNRYVFFTHPQQSDITFYTDDRSILKSPEILYEPELKPILAKLNRRKQGIWIGLSLVVGIFAAALIALFVFKGTIVERLANLVPPAQEQELAKTMLTSAIAGKALVKDSAISSQLASITNPLVKALDDTAFHFSFTIIKDPTLNAFALPGGAVVIHSGLIEKAHSAEEVAGVLAHEISHVSRRHHLRGIIGNMGIFFIIRGLLGDVAGISNDIATAGAALSTLKYSRGFETEADNNGLQLLEKARINPQGMVSFFETLQKENKMPEISAFMSTHPATADRIENLKTQITQGKKYNTIPVNFTLFQENINTYFKDKK